jgi:ribonuclease HI
MPNFILLSDGSVNTQTKIGYGAYLLLLTEESNRPMEELETRIQLKRFEQTASTQLELQTLLWALSQLPQQVDQLTIYSDSHNIISLPQRRPRLEQQNFIAANGKTLSQAELYRQYFHMTDRLNCTFVQLQGHQPDRNKGTIEKIFTLVDRASRRALRTEAQAKT